MTNDDDLARNLDTCSTPDQWSAWFEEAEGWAEEQWGNALWPYIKDGDFTTTIEIGPGAGRNAERLKEISKTLHLVDMNDYALERCRARFNEYEGPCQIHVVKNDGLSLPSIADESATYVFSWDSMVHFDKAVIGAYVKEFARVMVPGAKGYVHHSNFGAISNESDIHKNPHMRSNQSAANFVRQCEESGLVVTRQIIFDWAHETDLDCISLFRKPA